MDVYYTDGFRKAQPILPWLGIESRRRDDWLYLRLDLRAFFFDQRLV